MALQDYYNTGDDANGCCGSTRYIGQTFIAGSDYNISSVKLKLWGSSSYPPGTVTVSIRATSGNMPTGADLASGTTNGDTLPIDAGSAEWREITFGSAISLTSGVKYAIVLKCAGAEITSLLWRDDVSSPSYADGTYVYSSDSGSSWSIYTDADMMFETWGTAPVIHEATGSSSGTGSTTATATGTFLLGGTIAGLGGVTGNAGENWEAEASVAGVGGLAGEVIVNVNHEAAGVIAVSGEIAGTLVADWLAGGSIAGAGSMAGLFFIESFIWAKDRPSSYDKTKVYDEATQTWITSDNRGGSRFRNQIIVMAKQDDGNAKLYYSGV